MGKKKLLILISSIVAILAIALTIIIVVVVNNNKKPEDNFIDSARSIKVVQIDGSATVTDEKETINCFKGMNLYDGDSLNVDNDSVVVIKFDEDKYVYLGQNTTVNIKSEGKEKFKTNVFVEKGLVLAELQNKLGLDEEFFLSANNSVMAVRGTIFGLSVNEVGDNIVEAYSVYQGVTELITFDVDDDGIIKGKLTDISNSKIEINIPKSHVLTQEQSDNLLSNWLSDIETEFDDEEDANSKLNGVNITVSEPSSEDYQSVIDILYEENEIPHNDPIKYSNIIYSSSGYFGTYDGNPHSININTSTPNCTIYYKGEGESEYKTTNDYEFIAPGSYRVYYKIVCEGYTDKEDFEVIYITYPNIIIETDAITYDIASASSKLSLDGIEDEAFNAYNGVLANKILSNAKYYINDVELNTLNVDISYDFLIEDYIELKDGKNILHAKFDFIDYSFEVDINFIFVDSRENLGYSIAAINDNVEEIGESLYFYGLTNQGTAQTEYVEINAIDLLEAFGIDLEENDLENIYINLPYEKYENNDMADYNGLNIIRLDCDEYIKFNFLIFPTSKTKGFNETIYIYASNEFPLNTPIFSVKDLNFAYNPEKNPEGALIDFIDSSYEVKYSKDGESYNQTLYIKDEGSYKIYFQIISNDDVIDGFEYINVITGESKITFDNLKFITNPIYILSNDGYDLTYKKYIESNYIDDTIISNNGKIISSLDDCYTIYSNLIKNSLFYDSITKDEINVTVTISEKLEGSADFNYVVSAEGYDSISGNVKFEYANFGSISSATDKDTYFTDSISVDMPTDLEIDLNDISSIIVSRPELSCENVLISYKAYYSIDEGKTWTKDVIKITDPGEYDIYTLYCFVDPNNDATDLVDSDFESEFITSLSATGNFIVSIQHIIVEE